MGAKKSPFLTQMVKSMKEHGWKSYSVIIVDKYYNVLDGNMRLLAAMEAGVPVRFVIDEKVKIKSMSDYFNYHNNYNTHLKNKHKYNRLSK